MNNPHDPIIYVRGFAMTKDEVDDTTADPFNGFNLGSTVLRARVANRDEQAPVRKHVFESPVIRLGAEFGYQEVFEDGCDIVDPDWKSAHPSNGIPRNSIVIFRYYEEASRLLGRGEIPSIEHFARKLSELIRRVEGLVALHDQAMAAEGAPQARPFGCYLVAHSMGGLICRAMLQNAGLDTEDSAAKVRKFFTYATPHNGIGITQGNLNVPGWARALSGLGMHDVENFNHERMARYLDVEGQYRKFGRVDWIQEERFPSRHVFCMVGTNRLDYEVAAGAARTFVGKGSDGLVRIENATLWGYNARGDLSGPCATAYAFRSHSGFFGIVNSEESYQNLIRFLFGDVRVDMWLDIESVTLPMEVEAEKNKGREINALHLIEILAAPRGKRWHLTRRVAEEDSAACRTYAELMGGDVERKKVYLSTIFLGNRWKTVADKPSVAYSVELSIKVPEYEVNRSFWPDGHIEGRPLFRDTLWVEIFKPANAGGAWPVHQTWLSKTGNTKITALAWDEVVKHGGEVRVPVTAKTNPGIKATLRLSVSGWNA